MVSAFAVVLAALAISATAPADASTILYRTDAELVMLSDRVVHARVVRQRVARPDGPDGAIYTVSTLAVLEDFTGVEGTEVEAWELGGTMGSETMFVGGAVTYEVGSTVLVCLERGRFGYRSVAMGFSRFDVEPRSTRDGSLDGRLTRRLADVSVLGGPASRRADLSLAEFRNLATRLRGVTPRRNREAESAFGEPEVTAGFGFLGPLRWRQADFGTPVTWYLNTAFPTPLLSGNGVGELQLALHAWTAPTTASIILQYGGTINIANPKDGVPNGVGVVSFEDPFNEMSGSTLAIGGGFGGGATSTASGMTFGGFTRGYIIFQNAAALPESFRQSTDFARVMEHEIGHTIGLGHSDQASAIMYPSCCSGSTPFAPNLGPDDLAGLQFIYPVAGGPPPAVCTYSIAPTEVTSIAGTGGSGSVSVNTQAGCTWTAASNTSFITVTSGSSGTGNGTVGYSVAASDTTSPRNGTMTIAGQTFNVSQLGATCSYTLTPSSASAARGAGSGTVTVTTNIATCGWTAGSASGFLGITSGAVGTGTGTVGYSIAANAAVSFRTGTLIIAGQPFTVTQSGSGPSMSLDKASLNYGVVVIGGSFASQTTAQTVRLSQSGAGPVTWTATPTVPWLTVSPSSGSGPAELTVSVVPHFTIPGGGTIAGGVTLSFSGAGTPAGPLPVSLRIFQPGISGGAVGLLDTPLNNSVGVTGSIAVAGWAVDDIQVSQVRIVRDPVAGEGTGLIPIGTAVFVDGSRPDVASFFNTTPRATRAGWGYLMLTNFLPNEGNGTFRIHAYADDVDGHSTLIGSATITCTNATAVRPFGAIDTPRQGETVSGLTTNFGWVLARTPALAYPPHGTVSVLIDGVAVGSPGGWAARPDLVALFPAATYPGVANALGVAGIDTTTLSNGLHTIAWIVRADNGRTDGIGSRFFTVSNTTTSPLTSAAIVSEPTTARLGALAEEIAAARGETAGVRGRRGFDVRAPFRRIRAAAGQPATMYGEELDRFELRFDPRPGTLTGHVRTSDGFAPLPAGSNLDAANGVFTWQPGPGFVHGYDLVFVRWNGGRAVSRQDVRFEIGPRASNRIGTQVTIDAPIRNSVVTGPFMLGGWAVNMDADSGSGINTVHVWAYPVGGAAPLFVGEAAIHGHRPDVAAYFGDQFADSGYGLIVDNLPPGTYDVAVFASSPVTGGFAPAKLVRVTVR